MNSDGLHELFAKFEPDANEILFGQKISPDRPLTEKETSKKKRILLKLVDRKLKLDLIELMKQQQQQTKTSNAYEAFSFDGSLTQEWTMPYAQNVSPGSEYQQLNWQAQYDSVWHYHIGNMWYQPQLFNALQPSFNHQGSDIPASTSTLHTSCIEQRSFQHSPTSSDRESSALHPMNSVELERKENSSASPSRGAAPHYNVTLNKNTDLLLETDSIIQGKFSENNEAAELPSQITRKRNRDIRFKDDFQKRISPTDDKDSFSAVAKKADRNKSRTKLADHDVMNDSAAGAQVNTTPMMECNTVKQNLQICGILQSKIQSIIAPFLVSGKDNRKLISRLIENPRALESNEMIKARTYSALESPISDE